MFESHETSYGALTALIKIQRQLSHVMQICGVIFYLCMRTVLDLVVSSQVNLSFLSNLHVWMKTCQKTACQFFSPKKPKRRKSEPAGSALNKIFGS